MGGNEGSIELEEGMIGGCDINDGEVEIDSFDLSSLLLLSYYYLFIYTSCIKEQNVEDDKCGSKDSGCEGIEESVEHVIKGDNDGIGIMK